MTEGVRPPTQPKGSPRRRTPGVESPRKVLLLLLSYSERRPSATIPELAAAADVPVSTAYRYVSLLREVGLLEEGEGSTYHVGPRVLAIARAAVAASSLVSLARPVMTELAAEVDETVMLVRAIAGAAVCVDLVESSRAVRLSVQPGQPLAMHAGASGKTLLAFLPAAERESILAAKAAADPSLAGRLDALRVELGAISQRGWTTSQGEIDEGIWACSAAVLPRDDGPAIATLSVAGPSYRIGEPEQQRILDGVRAAAAELRRRVTPPSPATV